MDMLNFLRYWKPRRQISLPSMLHSREKEKKVLPCQQEYEIACAQLDE